MKHSHRPNLVQQLLTEKTMLAEELADDNSRLTRAMRADLAGDLGYRIAAGQEDIDIVAELRRRWLLSLAVAENIAVTADLCALVATAGQDLPDDMIPEHHHLFVEHGFILLEAPIYETRSPIERNQPIPVSALSFHHGEGWSDRYQGVRAGIEINLWTRTERLGQLVPLGSDFLPYGLPAHPGKQIISDDETSLTDRALSDAARFVLALQHFLRTELPARETWSPPRSMMRWLRTAPLPPRDVTVIDLRRRASSGRAGDAGWHLTNRHIVRGHWHAYWVGETHPLHSHTSSDKEKVHVYLSPYLKGPDDAPIVNKPKVNLVRR